MKKFTISMIAVLIFVAGAACGGGSSWSDADKAQLAAANNLATKLGILSQKQVECYSDWIQSHYDSMADANNHEKDSEAQASLKKACNIDANSSGSTKVEPTTTTTTTVPAVEAVDAEWCKETLKASVEGIKSYNMSLEAGSNVKSDVSYGHFVSAVNRTIQKCVNVTPSDASVTQNMLDKFQKAVG